MTDFLRRIVEKKHFAYVVFSPFLLLVFGLKDFLILTSEEWPHLYAVVNTPRASWEEVFCYLPFASHFSWINLMPSAPMASPGTSQFTFFPVITLIIQGLIFKVVCFSNIDVYVLFMHTLFPILSFWMIFSIFNSYTSASWSLLFTFLGVTSFPNFAFFPYLGNVISNPFEAIQTASMSPMELTRSPIPSFTFFFFIFSFFLSTKETKPGNGRCYAMSLLWATNIYVYMFNFVAGTLFWFLYLIYVSFIKNRKFIVGNILKTLLANGVIVFAVISPVLVKFFLLQTPLDKEIFQRMEIVFRSQGFIVNDWGVFFSFIFPLLTLAAIVWIYCADFYELFYKFTPVFIVILVEVIVSNLHIIFGEFFQPQLFSIRIADYFMRFFYFIPIIYFLSRPYKKLYHYQKKHRISKWIHTICDRYIHQSRGIISVIGIFIISLFCLFSTLRYVTHFRDNVAPRMKQVEREFIDISSFVTEQHGIVVSEDIPVNLFSPITSRKESLLVNAFSNYVSENEILFRLILFAKIFNWEEEMFLDFMMPSKEYNGFNTDNAFLLSDKILSKGFGYWLMNHRKQSGTEELDNYRNKVLRQFNEFDLLENIKKYRIRAVQAFNPINPVIPVQSLVQRESYKIYLIKSI